jgi:hypothetical protein
MLELGKYEYFIMRQGKAKKTCVEMERPKIFQIHTNF